MSFFPDRPRTLREATTVISRYADRQAWIETRWDYYHDAIGNYLRARRVPSDCVHDLTMDLMLRLEAVMQQYDPRRGRFRPYLTRVLQNLHIDHLRAVVRHAQLPLDAVAEPLQPEVASAGEEEVENAAMLHYIRMAFLHFEAQALADCALATKLKRPLRVIYLLLMERRSQLEIMGELGISERQVRLDASVAAAALSVWIKRWVTDADLEELAAFARRKRIEVAFSLAGIAELFRHLSAQKIASIQLLMVVASRKPGARPTEPSPAPACPPLPAALACEEVHA